MQLDCSLIALSVFIMTSSVSLAVEPETPLTEANSWALSVPEDPFTGDALLDLRSLNETKSGQSGFMRLADDKNSFVLGNGEPARLWIVGTDAYRFSPDEMDLHARWLAKLGVNMVRLHVTVCDKKEGSDILDVDDKLIDGIHRFLKSAKDNGIYVIISPFYAHFDAPESWELPGGKIDLEGVIFIDPRLQNAYKHWTKELYTRPNPYTGLPIKDDPTVAILQIHNEDSLLFWTSQNLKPPHQRMLAGDFSVWLTEKYGSVQNAWSAWGDGFKGRDDLDRPDEGVIACLPVYELTKDQTGAYQKRLNDTAEFLAEYQRTFYASMGRYLREELGCRQMLNATNWRTANDSKLKDLERYSYHALDIDAENEYVGSDYQHSGPMANYRIDPGHYLVNESVLGKPFEMCTNWRQADGHPFILTETAWKNPNRYQSEGPFLVAGYQSLTGVDGVAWFSCQPPRYEEDPRKDFWRVGDEYAIHKWSHSYPAMMAGFPANALLFRKGFLKQAQPFVIDSRSSMDIFARKPPAIEDNETHGDARSLPDLAPGWKPQPGEVNRAAFLVGPVVTHLGERSHTIAKDLTPYLDAERGIIRAASGELIWDYKRELCIMDAPQAQGVTGFLARNGGQFETTDTTIESTNEYATVNIVSLTDEPIAQSQRVLLQVVTVNRLTGYETKPATFAFDKDDDAKQIEGEQIVRIGQPPLRIEHTHVSVTVKNPSLKSATVLDINGYPKSSHPVVNGRFELSNDAIYVVLRSESK